MGRLKRGCLHPGPPVPGAVCNVPKSMQVTIYCSPSVSHGVEVAIKKRDLFLPWFFFVPRSLRNIGKPSVVAHVFNPSTREAEAGDALRSRPAWCTE